MKAKILSLIGLIFFATLFSFSYTHAEGPSPDSQEQGSATIAENSSGAQLKMVSAGCQVISSTKWWKNNDRATKAEIGWNGCQTTHAVSWTYKLNGNLIGSGSFDISGNGTKELYYGSPGLEHGNVLMLEISIDGKPVTALTVKDTFLNEWPVRVVFIDGSTPCSGYFEVWVDPYWRVLRRVGNGDWKEVDSGHNTEDHFYVSEFNWRDVVDPVEYAFQAYKDSNYTMPKALKEFGPFSPCNPTNTPTPTPTVITSTATMTWTATSTPTNTPTPTPTVITSTATMTWTATSTPTNTPTPTPTSTATPTSVITEEAPTPTITPSATMPTLACVSVTAEGNFSDGFQFTVDGSETAQYMVLEVNEDGGVDRDTYEVGDFESDYYNPQQSIEVTAYVGDGNGNEVTSPACKWSKEDEPDDQPVQRQKKFSVGTDLSKKLQIDGNEQAMQDYENQWGALLTAEFDSNLCAEDPRWCQVMHWLNEVVQQRGFKGTVIPGTVPGKGLSLKLDQTNEIYAGYDSSVQSVFSRDDWDQAQPNAYFLAQEFSNGWYGPGLCPDGFIAWTHGELFPGAICYTNSIDISDAAIKQGITPARVQSDIENQKSIQTWLRNYFITIGFFTESEEMFLSWNNVGRYSGYQNMEMKRFYPAYQSEIPTNPTTPLVALAYEGLEFNRYTWYGVSGIEFVNVGRNMLYKENGELDVHAESFAYLMGNQPVIENWEALDAGTEHTVRVNPQSKINFEIAFAKAMCENGKGWVVVNVPAEYQSLVGCSGSHVDFAQAEKVMTDAQEKADFALENWKGLAFYALQNHVRFDNNGKEVLLADFDVQVSNTLVATSTLMRGTEFGSTGPINVYVDGNKVAELYPVEGGWQSWSYDFSGVKDGGYADAEFQRLFGLAKEAQKQADDAQKFAQSEIERISQLSVAAGGDALNIGQGQTGGGTDPLVVAVVILFIVVIIGAFLYFRRRFARRF